MGIKPDNYDRLIDISNTEQVKSIMDNGITTLNKTIQLLPGHKQFLANIYKAKTRS
jgi:hypothetical protein